MPKQKVILKGMTANRGKVQGKVRIIKGDILNNSQLSRELSKLKTGEILVTEMTRPLFVKAMRRAKGIVTDRGGILCHAAMVSREFKLPCLVNTKNATKKLTTGQRILLDASQGIIYEN